MEIENGLNYRAEIVALLESVKLPMEDLPPSLENFLVMHHGDQLVAVAGIESYGQCALLRSVAVSPAFRDQGVAAIIVESVENIAAAKGITAIYLLTETASDYFKRRGYIEIARIDIPAEVQKSSEFSHVCPQSAIAMEKVLSVSDNVAT